jgi:hypothetical protein
MGYYTRHELEILEGNDNQTDYAQDICDLADYIDLFDDEVKWYSHEEDMKTFSAKHQNTLFKLSGEGEESGDIWIEYHKDGKMQRTKANIVFDKYDESKLE